MILERLGLKKEKNFVPTPDDLEEIAWKIAETANSPYDAGIRNGLLDLCHIFPYGTQKFRVVTPGRFVGGVDLVTDSNGEAKAAFSLGTGEASVNFVNFLCFPDKMIHKSKPLTGIMNREDLEKTIDDFIRLEPTEGEIIDISKEAVLRKMDTYKDRPATLISLYSNPHKGHS